MNYEALDDNTLQKLVSNRFGTVLLTQTIGRKAIIEELEAWDRWVKTKRKIYGKNKKLEW